MNESVTTHRSSGGHMTISATSSVSTTSREPIDRRDEIRAAEMDRVKEAQALEDEAKVLEARRIDRVSISEEARLRHARSMAEPRTS